MWSEMRGCRAGRKEVSGWGEGDLSSAEVHLDWQGTVGPTTEVEKGHESGTDSGRLL